MKGEDLLELLKWVGVVFAAGFIGYFGKALAKKLLRGKKINSAPPPPDPELERDKIQAKQEKKRLKQQQKIQKKKNK